MRAMPDLADSAPPTGAARPTSLQRMLTGIVLLLVLGVAFSFAFTPLRSSQDEWWHLKAGKWIVENGRLPRNDIFTYTGENLRWHNHEWLAQVLFYSVHQLGEGGAIGGVRALISFKAVLVTATIALVLWLGWMQCRNLSLATLIALLAADMSRRTIFPRPPVLSYLLFAGFLVLLYQRKAGRVRAAWLWVTVPVMVVWANLHGMCLVGVVAVGSFALGECIEAALDWRRTRAARPGPVETGFARHLWRRAGNLVLLTIAVALAVLANPSGAEVYFLGRNFTADPVLKQVILEMRPAPFIVQRANPADPASPWMFNRINATFWLSVPVFLGMLAANRFRLRNAADYLLSLFFLYQAAMHWRLLPLFAIAGAGPTAFLAQSLLARLRLAGRPVAQWVLLAATALLGAVFVGVIGEPPPQTFLRRNVDLLRGKAFEPRDYPEPMVRFILDTRLPDRMFSEINYCGYLMWRLSPEHHRLFTDNRFDLFGSRFYPYEYTVAHGLAGGNEFANGMRVEKGWDGILDEWGVNFVVIARDMELNRRLRESGKWKVIYYYVAPGSPQESGFNIWLRDEPRFAEAMERARTNFARQNPMAPSPEEFERRFPSPAR
jgi:hypothetical protein